GRALPAIAESIRDDIMKMPVHRGAMKDSWLPPTQPPFSRKQKTRRSGSFCTQHHPDILSVASWQWPIFPYRCIDPSLQLLNWILPLP
ncbi:hypothetical protein K5D44_18410, partial [Pseudomonas cichorii]